MRMHRMAKRVRRGFAGLVVVGLGGTAAGVGAAAIPAVVAPPARPEPTVSAQVVAERATVHAGFRTRVDGSPDLVAVRWRGDRTARYAIETRRAGGSWRTVTETGADTEHAPDPDSAEGRRLAARPAAPLGTDPIWVGDADAVRVRLVRGSARDVTLERIDSPRAPAGVAGAATVAMPGIISRAQWGADESLRLANCPEGPDVSTNAKIAVVHHTAGSNNYSPGESAAIVRGLYVYATQTLDYCDAHYNFLVDKYGQIFEGRYESTWQPVRAAHATGMNTASVGVALIGDYSTVAPPPAMVDALERLLAWKLNWHGVDPLRPVRYTTISGTDRWPAGSTHVLPFVIGHRDPGTTSCPGEQVYRRLGAIRSNVAVRILGGGADVVGNHARNRSHPKVVTMSAFGTVYPAGRTGEVRSSGVWRGFPIARDVEMTGVGYRGATLDGYGGIHPFGGATVAPGAPYWSGFDIARDLVLRPAGGGWVLDGFGGVHAFGGAPKLGRGPYFRGFDVARKLVRFQQGWYVLDGFGGLHPLGSAPHVSGPYWPGWFAARDVVANPDGPGGYLLDLAGGVWPVGGAPALTGPAPRYFGDPVAVGLVVLPGGEGYTLRDDGFLARFGGAPTLVSGRATWEHAAQITTPWVMRGVAGRA